MSHALTVRVTILKSISRQHVMPRQDSVREHERKSGSCSRSTPGQPSEGKRNGIAQILLFITELKTFKNSPEKKKYEKNLLSVEEYIKTVLQRTNFTWQVDTHALCYFKPNIRLKVIMKLNIRIILKNTYCFLRCTVFLSRTVQSGEIAKTIIHLLSVNAFISC